MAFTRSSILGDNLRVGVTRWNAATDPQEQWRGDGLPAKRRPNPSAPVCALGHFPWHRGDEEDAKARGAVLRGLVRYGVFVCRSSFRTRAVRGTIRVPMARLPRAWVASQGRPAAIQAGILLQSPPRKA